MTDSIRSTDSRPPYLWALLATAVVFVIYVVTLAPTTAFWDTSEYIAAAKVLGIPHPPGNPLFTILAHTFGALPLAASYAVRINLFAAFTSALSAGLWFLVAERWMRNVVPVRWARLAAAAAGVLVSATSWTVWNQSTVNEKVYTVSMLSMALVVWLAVHWADDRAGPHRDRWVILIAYIIALSSTNHLMGVLAAPAVAVYVLWTDWRVITRPWVVAGVIGAVVVGISLNYLYLPIRAGLYPAINEGEPVGFFSQALSDVLSRVQYGKPSVLDRQATIWAQMWNYGQYFAWQYARDYGRVLQTFATLLFAGLGLGGAYTLWMKDRRAAIASISLMATLTLALIVYLNFKYGFSYPSNQADLLREVRERDYFFVCSFAAFGVWVAVGFGALMQAAVAFLRDRGTESGRWAIASTVLALAFIPSIGNRLTASRAHETAARDFAVDMLESVEPYGILITAGDNDTFPLWYAQEVEGVRTDVTLANLSLLNTRWHLRQIKRRVTPDFDPARAAALWRTRSWPRPANEVFAFSVEALDSLPEYIPVKRGPIMFDSVQVVIGADYLELKDLAVLALIRDNLGKRRIYFSWSDGPYPDQTLGLTPYLVTQGMVRRLEPKPVVPTDSIVVTQGLAYMDLPRTTALLWDTYHYPSIGRPRPRGWVDPPSSSILGLYRAIYGTAAQTYRQLGDTTRAVRADSVSQAILASLYPAGQ